MNNILLPILCVVTASTARFYIGMRNVPSILLAVVFGLISVGVNAATLVTLKDNQIVYHGSLTAEANAKVFSLYETSAIKPTLLSIRSPGGPIDVGLDLGEWTHRRKIDVRVDEFCFSSCANYVFPAGAKKYLDKDAIVAFHGGASSENFNMSQLNNRLATIPVQQRAQVRTDLEQQLKKYLESNRKRESDFYAMIKVSQKITTLGHESVYSIYQKTGFKGWYYSLEDMAKLGLKDIQLINGHWNPEQQERRHRIFKVSLDNI